MIFISLFFSLLKASLKLHLKCAQKKSIIISLISRGFVSKYAFFILLIMIENKQKNKNEKEREKKKVLHANI